MLRSISTLASASLLAGAVIATTPAGAAAGRCPATLPSMQAGANQHASFKLVPSGARHAVLCRYAGLNDPSPQTLAGSGALRSRRKVRALAKSFNRLPEPGSEPRSCPSDDGSVVIARFAYRHAPEVTVWTRLGGCNQVTNGALTRLALGHAALLARLQRLTGSGH
jgi:hypothetical protein